jgi:predicted RecB family endonuclease
MIRHSRIDANTAERAKRLGAVGERIAKEVLAGSGFKKIRNLNQHMTNFPFADVYAERGGHRYAISVKIRNKFETTGRLNSRYKLGQIATDLRPLILGTSEGLRPLKHLLRPLP